MKALVRAWRKKERREDIRAAMICCAVRNSMSTKKRWKIEDFIGKDEEQSKPARRKTSQELMEAFLAIARRHQASNKQK